LLVLLPICGSNDDSDVVIDDDDRLPLCFVLVALFLILPVKGGAGAAVDVDVSSAITGVVTVSTICSNDEGVDR
jgi:hypothetical protein